METQMQQRTPPLRGTLYRVLEARFGGDPRAINLCSEFLSHETYDRHFVTKLISVCDGSAGYSWNLRLFATLMLSNQCRQLGTGCDEEFRFLFRKFGILPPEANRWMTGSSAKVTHRPTFEYSSPNFWGTLVALGGFIEISEDSRRR